MIPSYKIGKTRIELAKILSEYTGKHVSPATIERNRAEDKTLARFLRYNSSWYVKIGDKTYISPYPMTKFVSEIKKGKEIFQLENGNQIELMIKSK